MSPDNGTCRIRHAFMIKRVPRKNHKNVYRQGIFGCAIPFTCASKSGVSATCAIVNSQGWHAGTLAADAVGHLDARSRDEHILRSQVSVSLYKPEHFVLHCSPRYCCVDKALQVTSSLPYGLDVCKIPRCPHRQIIRQNVGFGNIASVQLLRCSVLKVGALCLG